MRVTGRYTALICAAGILFAPMDALCQANQQDLDAAREACAKSDYAKAIPIFRRITVERENMNARLHFAVCLEKKNDWQEAIGLLESVIDAAQITINSGTAPPTTLATAKKRLEQASILLANLRTRMPKLQFLVSGDEDRLEELQVDVNGQPMAPSRWGQAFEVNPGIYRFTSRIPDGSLATMVVVADGKAPEGITYPVQLVLPADPKKKDIKRRNIGFNVGVGLIGLGAAGLVTGAVFVGLHSNSNGSRDASTYRGAAIGAFVAGGLILGGGITLTTLSSDRSGGKPSTSNNVTLMVSPWGAGLAGRF